MLGAVASLLLFGCGVTVPPDAESYDPPSSYRAVWDSAVACTGLHTRRFQELHFFVVPGEHSFWSHGEWAAGTTDGQGNITFAGDYMYHPMIVKRDRQSPHRALRRSLSCDVGELAPHRHGDAGALVEDHQPNAIRSPPYRHER
jgi:hypothetical protein